MQRPNPSIATVIRPFDDDAINDAAARIRAGECVAIPTETVYGLAADATNGEAVASVYAAKGRPSFNPLIVHVADIETAKTLAEFGGTAEALATQFWPGPLTMVLPQAKDSPIADIVTAGLDTIAIRIPAHPAMRALLQASDRPIAAPSANSSGRISPTQAEHVRHSLDGKIGLISMRVPPALAWNRQSSNRLLTLFAYCDPDRSPLIRLPRPSERQSKRIPAKRSQPLASWQPIMRRPNRLDWMQNSQNQTNG